MWENYGKDREEEGVGLLVYIHTGTGVQKKKDKNTVQLLGVRVEREIRKAIIFYCNGSGNWRK